MNRKYFDTSYSPGDDFFKFATNKWIDYHPWNKEYSRWGTFSALDEKVVHQLRDLLAELKNDVNNPYAVEMNKFYNKMTDYETRETAGGSYLNKHIYRINSVQSKEELISLMHNEYCINLLVSTGLAEDEKSPDDYIVYMYQMLSFENRDYYSSVSNDDDKLKYICKWKEIAHDAFYEAGISEEYSYELIENFFRIENEIAVPAYSNEELDVPELNYHMMTIEEASKELDYDIKSYLDLLGFKETDKLNICQIEPVRRAFELFGSLSLNDLKKYATYKFVHSNLSILTEKIKDIVFEYNRFAYGVEKRPERWKSELATMEELFSEIFGKVYISKYFDEASKHRMEALVETLRTSYGKIIMSQDWLSDKTKETAMEKLSKMTYKIGYPNKWIDYSDLFVDDTLNYVDLNIELGKYFYRKFFERCYNKKVDKELWHMSPQTVNAYYNPCINEIVFPAGILQDPFFIKDGTDAENYGSIGVVIGHEMTHGFDSNGRVFDPSGCMNDWWTPEDADKFTEYTADTIEHFDTIECGVRDLKVNGELTKNENIADCGGLRIAYLALSDKYNGQLSKFQKQEFFLAYAQTWSCVWTDESMEYQIANNVHSPNFARVNGTLPMIDEWYDAFDINENDKLYLNKEKRSKLWAHLK